MCASVWLADQLVTPATNGVRRWAESAGSWTIFREPNRDGASVGGLEEVVRYGTVRCAMAGVGEVGLDIVYKRWGVLHAPAVFAPAYARCCVGSF